MSFVEIAFILILALLLFGPKKLPEVGKAVGKALGELRRATNEFRHTLESEVRTLESEADLEGRKGAVRPRVERSGEEAKDA